MMTSQTKSRRYFDIPHQDTKTPISFCAFVPSWRKVRRGGFTLVELLIVVAIIGILATISITNMLNAQVRSKVAVVRQDHGVIGRVLELYHVDYNDYPPGLNPFARPGAIVETWRLTTPSAYMSDIPKDPFYMPQFFGLPGGPFGPGGPYEHYVADPIVTEFWLLWSYGPDRDMEFSQVDYDPTNGTISDGDLYLVGIVK